MITVLASRRSVWLFQGTASVRGFWRVRKVVSLQWSIRRRRTLVRKSHKSLNHWLLLSRRYCHYLFVCCTRRKKLIKKRAKASSAANQARVSLEVLEVGDNESTMSMPPPSIVPSVLLLLPVSFTLLKISPYATFNLLQEHCKKTFQGCRNSLH